MTYPSTWTEKNVFLFLFECTGPTLRPTRTSSGEQSCKGQRRSEQANRIEQTPDLGEAAARQLGNQVFFIAYYSSRECEGGAPARCA